MTDKIPIIPSMAEDIGNKLLGKIPSNIFIKVLDLYAEEILANYKHRFEQVIGWKGDQKCVQGEVDLCQYLHSELIAILAFVWIMADESE